MAARDAYIDVVLDRSAEAKDTFFARHATHILSAAERITVLELLELERHTQLMYTSCGWFFDEISGIETVQIIAYAAASCSSPRNFSETQAPPRRPVPRHPRPRQIQLARARRRRRNLSPLRHRHPHQSRPGRRPLRHQLHLPQLPEDGELFCFDSTAMPTRASPPAAAKSRSAAPASAPASPRRRKTSSSPYSTLAIKISPPPSAATPTESR